MGSDPVRAALDIAEGLLYPDADAIDAAPVVPRRYLDALAAAGLYDLPGDPSQASRVVEAIGGASLVTAFVWIQHHSPVRAVASAGGPLAERWVSPLRSGGVRAGIAYAALRRPGPPAAVAEPAGGGAWRLGGHAPWVTGWGLVDVVMAGARHGDEMVWMLIDAEEASGLEVRPVQLAALQASSTVELRWERFGVPAERVVAVEPYDEWRRRDAAGRSLNGYLAVGVAARAARLLGESPAGSALTAEVAGARAALDRSTPATVADARARASLLAVKAATALVAAGGGRSVEAGSTAARLMREATFLLVFGQSPDIRAAQLDALSA